MRNEGAEWDLSVPGQPKDIPMSCKLLPTGRRSVLFAVTALSAAQLVCLQARAAEDTPQPDMSITVFADRYVIPERVIHDLDGLEDAVGSPGPRKIRLNACGPAAERAQRAAAHRFRNSGLELRWLPPHAAHCQAAIGVRAMPANIGHGARPHGIDDALVDRWWHERMP